MRREGASIADVSSFMGCALIAALLLQWPVARLADRFDRRSIIFAVTTVSALCSAAVFILPQGSVASAFNYLYVAVVFTLYGAIVSHANDTAPRDQRIAVSAGLLLIFALGASAGPTLASATMALAGPAGLYLFTAGVTGALALLTARSLRGQRAVASG
jgi:MFS family permease